MRKTGTEALTVSNFLKKDVEHMLWRTVSSGEIETACYMAAELVCTPEGGLLTLCSLLSDLVADVVRKLTGAGEEKECNGNTKTHPDVNTIVHTVSRRLRFCLAASSDYYQRFKHPKRASRRPSGSNPDPSSSESPEDVVTAEHHVVGILHHVCTLVTVLAAAATFISAQRTESESRTASSTYLPRHSRPSSTHRRDNAEEAFLLAPHFSRNDTKIRRAFHPAALPDRGVKVLRVIYETCGALLAADALRLVSSAANVAETKALSSSLNPCFDQVDTCFPCCDYAEIRDVPARQKSDVVWYLWRLCLLMADGPRRALVDDALYLYKIAYKKAARAARHSLLLYGFGVVMDDGDVAVEDIDVHCAAVRHPSAEERIFDAAFRRRLEKARAGVHIVYEDVLVRNDYASQSYAPAPAPPTLITDTDDTTNPKDWKSPPVGSRALSPCAPTGSTKNVIERPFLYTRTESRHQIDEKREHNSAKETDVVDVPESATLSVEEKVSFMYFFTAYDYAAKVTVEDEIRESQLWRAEHEILKNVRIRSCGGGNSGGTPSTTVPSSVRCAKYE